MTSHWVTDDNAALMTDLYELTMLQAYHKHNMRQIAVFDFFVRRLPENRNFIVACGLEHVLHYLETFHFTKEDLDYLRSLNRFSEDFLDHLGNIRFSGDVYAVPEGTMVFANEPILEVVAPIGEAQLVETFVMNQIHFASLAASKAARVVNAAHGRTVVDFGVRRMHGADAGIKAARAFYIAGVDATSNTLAGEMYGIPVSGTMAHSYVQSHDNEYDAFRRFLETMPAATLLVDTYDALEGVRHVIRLAEDMGHQFRAAGIRLDSGNLATLARESRKLLDDAGLTTVQIFASSSLDEYEIDMLIRAGAPIDGFGVGTRMGVSADTPFFDCAYKLVEYDGTPRVKRSPGKATLPGRKQIFRQVENGVAVRDILGFRNELVSGEPLLQPTMIAGRRNAASNELTTIRDYCRNQMKALPPHLLTLEPASPPYPVILSPMLEQARTTFGNAQNR